MDLGTDLPPCAVPMRYPEAVFRATWPFPRVIRDPFGGLGPASCGLFDGVMDGAAVTHDIVMSAYELLEWRIDIVEVNIGDEAIDAGVNAGRSLAMQITTRRD